MVDRNKDGVLRFQSVLGRGGQLSQDLEVESKIEIPRSTTLHGFKYMQWHGATSLGAGRQCTTSGRDFVSLKRRNYPPQREEASCSRFS